MFDVTMTACNRPELLERTLRSFFIYFIGLKKSIPRLIINIDPVGTDAPIQDTLDICYNYFSEVVWNTPWRPSFPKASKWVWSQIESPIIFHLEDDWEMLREVSLSKMLDILYTFPDLAILRLPAFASGTDTMKNWNKFFNWNGIFFECPLDLRGGLGFCGHPSLIKKSFISYVFPYLDATKNIEKQIKHHNKPLTGYLNSCNYGVYAQQNEPPAIQDTGRQWMIDNKYHKKGSKAFFTVWEKC
jgi:hypothetical protein